MFYFRRFGSQLLTNGQAPLEKNNCKARLVIYVLEIVPLFLFFFSFSDGVKFSINVDHLQKQQTENVGPAKAKAMGKKEVVVKPKNDAVIAIDPENKSGVNVREASSKKSAKSLTAILTARSKVKLVYLLHIEKLC